MKRALAVAACLWLPCGARGPADEPFGLPLSGDAAETFLKTARGRQEEVARGRHHALAPATRSTTARARRARVWKTIDESKPGRHQLPGRRLRGGLRGLLEARGRLLRARQARRHGARAADGRAHASTASRGSLQLWVEKAMTEADRKQSADRAARRRGLEPPDVRRAPAAPAHVQHRRARTSATCSCDPTFRVYAVDFSRAFAIYDELRAEKELVRFSRQALERLRALDRPTLDAKLGPLAERPPDRRDAQAPRQDPRARRAAGGREGREQRSLLGGALRRAPLSPPASLAGVNPARSPPVASLLRHEG